MRVRWDYMESIRIVRNGSMGYTAISHLMEKKLGWTASGGFVRGCRDLLAESIRGPSARPGTRCA